jgi:Predicted endonuclease distantly related to archaeal Holliday junction resolvase
MERKATGRIGEEAAQRYLEAVGYRLVDVNVRFGAKSGLVGELDIVAWDGPTLCFVEVKTRRGRRGYAPRRAGETPAESVTPAKQRQIARLALAYAARHGLLADDTAPGAEAVPLRFDVAAVTLLSDAQEDGTGDEPVCRVQLARGAFLAPDDFAEGF